MNLKHMVILIGAGAAAYFVINTWVIKDSPDDPGFLPVPMSEGFGLDDVVLGGGTALLAGWLTKLVRL